MWRVLPGRFFYMSLVKIHILTEPILVQFREIVLGLIGDNDNQMFEVGSFV